MIIKFEIRIKDCCDLLKKCLTIFKRREYIIKSLNKRSIKLIRRHSVCGACDI